MSTTIRIIEPLLLMMAMREWWREQLASRGTDAARSSRGVFMSAASR